jgi:hypothetical protein
MVMAGYATASASALCFASLPLPLPSALPTLCLGGAQGMSNGVQLINTSSEMPE